jgi:hypothetical protein
MSTRSNIKGTLLKDQQRRVILADTGIDRILLDRCCDAFDALINRGDVDAYKVNMKTAIVQMGYGRPIKEKDRPTAVDKAKTILIKAYADREHITFQQSAARIKRLLEGQV